MDRPAPAPTADVGRMRPATLRSPRTIRWIARRRLRRLTSAGCGACVYEYAGAAEAREPRHRDRASGE
eukprot:1181903-Prorocentrum_minimum.AAC.1